LLDNVKSKSDFDKTKPLDAKSKFESKSHGSKEGTPSAEEKDGTTSNTFTGSTFLDWFSDAPQITRIFGFEFSLY
jgi:hypothetical protein